MRTRDRIGHQIVVLENKKSNSANICVCSKRATDFSSMTERYKTLGAAVGCKADVVEGLMQERESQMDTEMSTALKQFKSAPDKSLKQGLAATRMLIAKGKLPVLSESESQKRIGLILERRRKDK